MRLFKRPSTSPQLVSATPISQDEAATKISIDNVEPAYNETIRQNAAQQTPNANNDVAYTTETSMAVPSLSFSARKGTSRICKNS